MAGELECLFAESPETTDKAGGSDDWRATLLEQRGWRKDAAQESDEIMTALALKKKD